MDKFNVIVFDINRKKFIPYNIMPYIINRYKEEENKPKTIEEFTEFVKKVSMYQWWSRCEYEIILSDWPRDEYEEKWDVYMQVMMNLDIITQILMKNISSK